MAAEAAVVLHRQLQVYARAPVQPRKRRSRPRFGREVRAECVWCDVKRRQANAAYRDALANAQLFRSGRGLDGDPTVLTALLDAYDLAHFLDDSGKHKGDTSFRRCRLGESLAPPDGGPMDARDARLSTV